MLHFMHDFLKIVGARLLTFALFSTKHFKMLEFLYVAVTWIFYVAILAVVGLFIYEWLQKPRSISGKHIVVSGTWFILPRVIKTFSFFESMLTICR